MVLRPGFFIGALVGICTILLLPKSLRLAVREPLAWCLGGTTYLALAFRIMAHCPPDRIRTRAARQDDSATVFLALILLAVFSSFAGIVDLLGAAKAASNEGKLLYVALAAATILVSWTVTQVTFTLHYTHEYYVFERLSGRDALAFPASSNPDYWDFFYFATSFGAASQTSDVAIVSKSTRRLATLHAIVSFFFNTIILASTINLAASLA